MHEHAIFNWISLITTRPACVPWYFFLIYNGNTRVIEKSTKLKITKMAGCAEEFDVVDESDGEIKRISLD